VPDLLFVVRVAWAVSVPSGHRLVTLPCKIDGLRSALAAGSGRAAIG
jgi:hypothetical protein